MNQIWRAEVFARIVPLLAELVVDSDLEDWEGEVSEQTLLIRDLGLTSVDFIDLFVAIEKSFGRVIGFHDLLMVNGRYVSDLSLGQLAEFLTAKLNEVADAKIRTPEVPSFQPAEFREVDAATFASFSRIIPLPTSWGDGPVKKNRRAIFVLSAPRSGSTLLQTILAGHPGLFAPPELHLLWFSDLRHRSSAFYQETNKHLLSGTIRALMQLQGTSVEQATRFMAECEDSGMSVSDFYGLLQGQLGDRLLVDKTPSNAYSLAVLRRMEECFEEPLYLQLVRHPGGMTKSFVDAKLERTVPFMMRHAADYSGEQFAELAWLTCNRNIADFLHEVPAGRQHCISYERLVTAPAETLRGVCDFLGLPFHLDMLDPYRDKQQRMADGLRTVGQMSGDLKFHLHSRIDPESAHRWQRFMSEDSLGALTWELAGQLGYSRRGAVAVSAVG